MPFDPPRPTALDTPPPEPVNVGRQLRDTFGFAVATVAVWMASAVHDFFVVYLLRRRLTAWRVVSEDGMSNLNVTSARLAEDQLAAAINLGWILVVAMFLIGAAWIHGAATNAMRSGAPDVSPGGIAARFAIPIVGIPFALRNLIRLLVSLGHTGTHVARWLNSMFAFFLLWIATAVLQLVAATGLQTDAAVLARLEIQVVVSLAHSVAIAIVTVLAVRAILHTDRTLRTPMPIPTPAPIS